MMPLLISLVLLSILFYGITIFSFNQIAHFPQPKHWPSVAVLVAARNEEQNLQRCLSHLQKVDYPNNQITFLLGNDHSTDQTASIMASFCRQDERFKMIPIGENLGSAKKKSNVLAHLANAAQQEILLFCDADTFVHPQWAKTLVKPLCQKPGISGGITIPEANKKWLSQMQQLDWRLMLSFITTAANYRLPSTVIGNNMGINRALYQQIGGYENLPYNITEDLQLYQEAIKRGGEYYHSFQPESLSLTTPASNLHQLLMQRRRWGQGALGLPHTWKLLLTLYFATPFLILLQAYYYPIQALMLYFLLLIPRFILHLKTASTCKQSVTLAQMARYEIYNLFQPIALLAIWPFNRYKNWKGRKF